MNPSQPPDPSPDPSPETAREQVASFDDIADELYQLPPAEFTAARDEHVRQLRAAGDRQAASAVSKLRRPTQAAWLVNVLWREHRPAVEELLNLAEPLRSAQERRDGAALRELSAERRRLANGLTDLLEEIAEGVGVRATADLTRAVGDTVDAAVADPEVAEQVRTGRLAQPTSYAGFGFAPVGGDETTSTAKPPPAAPAKKRAKRAGKPKSGDSGAEADEADKAAADRRAAEQRVADAVAALDEANANVRAGDEELRQATERRDEVKERIETLRRELQDLKDELSAADKDVRQATRRHEQATTEHLRGQRQLDRADEELKGLPQ